METMGLDVHSAILESPMDTVTFLELLSHRDCSKGHSSQHQTSLKTELVKEQLKPLARKDCSTSA